MELALDPLVLLLLILAAFLAGFIDSQVGGGGLITLPALLAAGLPPHLALGTNKLAATGASSSAAFQFVRKGLVEKRDAWLIAVAFVGSGVGALVVLRVAATDIQWLVAIVMAVLIVYVLAKPRFGRDAHPERRTPRRTVLVGIAVACIGFYDGFLGPGTGSFLLFALASLWGMAFLQAAALGRVLNFATNFAALLVFAWQSQVAYSVGLPMLIGTIAGGTVGSRLAIAKGSAWVRVLFVVVSGALLVRLLWGLL